MRVSFEGVGIGGTAVVSLPNDDTYLVDALSRALPSTQRLPWDQLWLSCEGRNLPFRRDALRKLRLHDGARIRISARLLGGGGDGGSTGAESRDAYLHMYKLPKADKVDAHEEKLAKWTCCQLSGEKLMPPCVCDELGTLFNKDAVIKALIEKTMPESLAHISSLKHLISLILTPKPASEGKEGVKDARNYQLSRDAEIQFHCPITDLEFNGAFRFSVHVQTGHVFSDRAIKDAPKAIAEILGNDATPEDWLPLNPNPDQIQTLWDKMVAKRKLSKRSKKRSRANKDTTTGKKLRSAVDYAPEEASKQIYASIFQSRYEPERETFLCRSVGARGMNLT